MPPMAGLQLICAIRSRFSVNSAVRRPMRAAAAAASQVLLVGFAAMIAADLIFALVPSVYGAHMLICQN